MKWRMLGGVVLVLAAAWSGWWWVGAEARRAGLEGWLAERRAEGWQAEARAVSVGGFPNRLDARVEGLALADPEAGWAWEAPFLDILSLSYAPDRAVLALPPEQVVAVPGARATVRSDALRASVRFAPGTALPLARFSTETQALAVESADWRLTSGPAQLHVQASDPAAGPANGYDIFLSAENVAPPAEALRKAGGLPAAASLVTLDARAAFDRPLDRFAVEDAPPQIVALSIKAAEARWGDLELRAQGSLRADARGFAEGEIALKATNWRAMLRAAAQSGAMERGLAQAVEAGLSLVAALSGGGETLEVPVSFSGGAARIGPVPVGRAPRLRRE